MLSCPKCMLTSHKSSKNLWFVAFQFQLHFYVGILYKYNQHKAKSCWEQLGASHCMHWGISPLLFFAEPPPAPPLNLQTAQASLFRQFPPISWFFVNPPWNKKPSSFLAIPLQKLRFCHAPPSFWKFGQRLIPFPPYYASHLCKKETRVH